MWWFVVRRRRSVKTQEPQFSSKNNCSKWANVAVKDLGHVQHMLNGSEFSLDFSTLVATLVLILHSVAAQVPKVYSTNLLGWLGWEMLSLIHLSTIHTAQARRRNSPILLAQTHEHETSPGVYGSTCWCWCQHQQDGIILWFAGPA